MLSRFLFVLASLTWVASPSLRAQAPQPGDAVLTYFGAGSRTALHDMVELSDGTLLLAGETDSLSWVPSDVPRTLVAAPALAGSSTGKIAFLLRASGDLARPLSVHHLAAGRASNFRWIRSSNLPGQPTGALIVSGQQNNGYFLARLDGNFVDAEPAGFTWTFNVAAANGFETAQPWDVGSDGRIVFAEGGETSATVAFLNASGVREVRPNLRGTHSVPGSGLVQAYVAPPGATHSLIRLPADLRSRYTVGANNLANGGDDEDGNGVVDYLEIHPDGNGQIRQGRLPFDIMIPTRVMPYRADGSATGIYGYNGYRYSGQTWIGAIVVDRRDGSFHVGFNMKSMFPDPSANKEQPDFEPGVVSYEADGRLRWWSRMYHEVIDANRNGAIDPGETYVSAPDQYVDGIAVDYSSSLSTGGTLVVGARAHGNNTSNFWSGNAVAARPGASGFQNRFTGTEGNIHITWIGKFRIEDGTYLAGTWLAGYWRWVSSSGQSGNWPTTPYADPVHDGWPDHNAGWAQLTTTRLTPGAFRVDAAGRVHVAVNAPRLVTTSNAHQKLPKRLGNVVNEGNSPWNYSVRTYEPDLSRLAYSSAITGTFTPVFGNGESPVGADNTEILSVFPTSHGLLAVGRTKVHSTTGTALGNPIPVANVPSWGTSTPTGLTGIAAVLPYSPSRVLPRPTLAATSGRAPFAIALDETSVATDAEVTWFVDGVERPAGRRALATFLEAGTREVAVRITRAGATSWSHFRVTVTPGAPVPGMTLEPGNLRLRTPTRAGWTYQLERSTSPQDPASWLPEGPAIPGDGSTWEAPLPAPSGEAAFWRVKLTPAG